MAEEIVLAELDDIEMGAIEHPAILARKAKGQAEQAAREAKEAVAEHQKELLRGAPLEILKQKKVAAQLAKEHATTTAEVQKMAEEVAEQTVVNVMSGDGCPAEKKYLAQIVNTRDKKRMKGKYGIFE